MTGEEYLWRYERAVTDDTDKITELVSETIRTVYPQYYPSGVVEFFCSLHRQAQIEKDIREGNVRVLRSCGKIIGTGTLNGNHITRVFVMPEHQHQGCGTYIMHELEREIGEKYNSAVLDASLPASGLYEKMGYCTVRHERIKAAEDAVLVYEVMEKILCDYSPDKLT